MKPANAILIYMSGYIRNTVGYKEYQCRLNRTFISLAEKIVLITIPHNGHQTLIRGYGIFVIRENLLSKTIIYLFILAEHCSINS